MSIDYDTLLITFVRLILTLGNVHDIVPTRTMAKGMTARMIGDKD